MVAVVSCPTCGREVDWSPAARYRPFCSERCKLIDLGAWASDSYSIPGAAPDLADDTPSDEGQH
jgi:uncharacterized protein